MRISVPQQNPDILAQIHRNNCKTILKTLGGLLLIWLFALLCILFYSTKQDISALTVCLVAGLLSLIPTKQLFPLISDQSWEGIIRKIEFLEEHDGRIKTTCRNTATRTKDGCVLHIMRLHILASNQKTYIKEFLWDNPKQIPPYCEGDTVRYYCGTNYPIFVDTEYRRPICVMCGCTTVSETGHCAFCSVSIIEAKEHVDT